MIKDALLASVGASVLFFFFGRYPVAEGLNRQYDIGCLFWFAAINFSNYKI